jgi:predicted DCC family thiol-disulfide oxidoreductase YuxK
MDQLKDTLGPNAKGIVFFDGLCPICHGSIYLLSRLDRNLTFLVSPLDGITAKKLGLEPMPPSSSHQTVILIGKDGERLEKAKAVVKILSELAYPAKCLSVIGVLPTWLLDAIYTLIARYRYVFFRKKDSCDILDKHIKKRFLP